jgi:DNA mismatch endonuclease Vsr
MERALRKLLKEGRFQNVPEGHSRRMKAIREKGNKSTETRLRALLIRAGIRGWKVHPPGLPGKPDFLFLESRLVVFVDGCYWHGCPMCGHIPRINKPYWKAKIERNQQRDRLNTTRLQEAGFRILRLWEHELEQAPRDCLRRLAEMLG